jgi:hypothetical protein
MTDNTCYFWPSPIHPNQPTEDIGACLAVPVKNFQDFDLSDDFYDYVDDFDEEDYPGIANLFSRPNHGYVFCYVATHPSGRPEEVQAVYEHAREEYGFYKVDSFGDKCLGVVDISQAFKDCWKEPSILHHETTAYLWANAPTDNILLFAVPGDRVSHLYLGDMWTTSDLKGYDLRDYPGVERLPSNYVFAYIDGQAGGVSHHSVANVIEYTRLVLGIKRVDRNEQEKPRPRKDNIQGEIS